MCRQAADGFALDRVQAAAEGQHISHRSTSPRKLVAAGPAIRTWPSSR
jgi:hypothetical protein